MGNARCPFRDFEICLGIVTDLDEDDIHIVLNCYISCSIAYETPGFYSFKENSEVAYTKRDHEETLQIECDKIA